MKKVFTILSLLLVMAITASAALTPVRITVTTTPNTGGAQLTIDVLTSAGSALATPISINKGATVKTDDGGVLSFILNEAAWTGATYNANNLVRITYGGVVLSIERMEVVYNKQGLFGALVDPSEISSGTTGYVLTTNGTTNSWESTTSALASWPGSSAITTVGTIGTGVWQGTPIANNYVAQNLTINGGSIINTPIGLTNPSTGAFTDLTVNGNTVLGAGAGPDLVTFGTNTTVTGNILPTTNGSGTLGDATHIWGSIYATNVNATTFTGALTGNAGSATKLATGRTIAITGDVTYTSPSFDGSANVTAAGTVARINGATLGTTTATDKNILIANGTSWVSQPMSGDVTILNTGATAIGATKVTPAKTLLTTTDWFFDEAGARITNLKGGVAGSIPYQTAVNATSLLAIGTVGQVLTVSAGMPVWTNVASSNLDLTAANTTLTINGDQLYDGSANRTIELNLSKDNTWLATQTFQTILPSTTNAYDLGAAAMSFKNVYSNGLTVNPFFTGSGNTGFIKLKELAANGTNFVGLRAADVLSADMTYTLPSTAPGVNGQMLVSQTDGTMSWTSLDADLVQFAGLSSTVGNFIVGSAGGWTTQSPVQVRTTLGAEPAFAKGDLSSTDITVTGGAGKLVGGNASLTILKGNLSGNPDPDGVLLITGGTGAVLGGGTTISVKKADATQGGYLSVADWTNFNSKLPYNAKLAAIAAMDLTSSTGYMLVSNGTTFGLTSPADIKTALALNNVTNTADIDKIISSATQTALNGRQPLDADLTTIAAFTHTDGNIMVSNGSNWVLESGLTARTSLGLGTMSTQNANAVDITGGTINGTTIGATTPSTAQFTIIDVKPVGVAIGATGSITLRELVANDVHGVTIKAPDAVTENYNIVLPSNKSILANQILRTNNTSGQLEWVNFDKTALGLGNVTDVQAIPLAQRGVANGVATLGADGKVPASQLNTPPTIVTVANALALAGINPGASNTIYVTSDNGKMYLWAGSANNYSEINPGLALGETTTTAYQGDRGKIAYDHSQLVGIGTYSVGNPHQMMKNDIGLSLVENTQLSSWPGTTNLNKMGVVTTGTWNASIVMDDWVSDDLTIGAGSTIDATPVGATTANTGRFSTMTLANSGGNVVLQSPAGANYTLTMPAASPAANEFLINSATPGQYVWATILPSMVGLGNVNNTSDLNKPLSTATINALALKQDYDADLTRLSAVTLTADQMYYTTDANILAALTTTSYGRGLLNTANAAGLQTHLGLLVGTNVQAYDLQLNEISALVPTLGSFMVGNGSAWTLATALDVRTAISAQPLAANLTNLATMGTAANVMLYSTGVNAWAEKLTTLYGRELLDLVNIADAQNYLGLTVGVNVQKWDDDLDDIAALIPTNGSVMVGNGVHWTLQSGAAAASAMGAQPLDATLTSIATKGTAANKMLYTTGVDTWAESDITAYGLTLIDDVDAATARTTLGLGTLATQSGTFSGTSSNTNTGDVTIGTANGLGLSGQALSLATASGSTTGALSSTDWTTFNSKQGALGYTAENTTNKVISFSSPTDVQYPSAKLVNDQLVLKANLAGATFTGAISATNLSGTNTGDQTITLTGDVTGTGTASIATVVGRINGTSLAGLATGILKNTTGTGVPSIAVAGDFPTLNQSTTGNAATATKLATARNINGVAFDGSANITITAIADASTLTGTSLNSTVLGSSLTSVGTLANLTVTNPISGSITGNAATATKLAATKNINGVAFDGSADITITAIAGTLTGTTLNSSVVTSSLTSVGTITTGTWSGTEIVDGKISDDLTLSTGSTIDNTPIGVTTANTGKFTTLESTSTFKLGTNGSTLNDIIKVTITQDVVNIAAGLTVTETFTVANAVLGSTVYISPSATFADGVIIAYAWVSSAGTVSVKFTNVTGAAIDPASMDFYITVIR